MFKNSWKTKKDILKDLHQCDQEELALNDFISDGSRPPRFVAIEDDDEFTLRFGTTHNSKTYNQLHDEFTPPDLHGITQMIRMVEEHQNSDGDSQAKVVEDVNAPKITITKLNPEVKEFVPKGSCANNNVLLSLSSNNGVRNCRIRENKQSKQNLTNEEKIASNSVKLDVASADNGMCSAKANKKNVPDIEVVDFLKDSKKKYWNDAKIDRKPSNLKTGQLNGVWDAKDNKENFLDVKIFKALTRSKEIGVNTGCIKIDKDIDVSSLKPEQLNDLTKKLKETISASSACDKFEGKRRKNVAIATLLKLHSSPSKSKPENKPLKLFTPDYFMQTKVKITVDNNEYNKSSLNNIDKLVEEEKTNLTQDFNECSMSVGKSTPATDIDSIPDKESTPSKSSPIREKGVPTPKKVNLSDPEIQESLKKVNSWLYKSENPKPKGPVLFLGTISYKRKESILSQSSETVENKISKPNDAVSEKFVPSPYADELRKAYTERNRKREALSLDIWSKLEKDLKARDEQLKLNSASTSSIDQEEISEDSTNSPNEESN